MADATAPFNVAQRLGGSIGISLLATFFQIRELVQGDAIAGFHYVIVLLVVMAAIGSGGAWMLSKGVRADGSECDRAMSFSGC